MANNLYKTWYMGSKPTFGFFFLKKLYWFKRRVLQALEACKNNFHIFLQTSSKFLRYILTSRSVLWLVGSGIQEYLVQFFHSPVSPQDIRSKAVYPHYKKLFHNQKAQQGNSI